MGPAHGIRTRQGAELRKRASVFQRSTRGPQARSESGRRSRTRHPSSPTSELETVLERGPFLFGPISWDSNPTGCGAEETRSVFQRSTRGPQARSESGRRSRTRHPSSPTSELLGLQRWRPFLFQAHRRGIRTRQHICRKGRGQKMAKMSTATLFATYKKIVFA